MMLPVLIFLSKIFLSAPCTSGISSQCARIFSLGYAASFGPKIRVHPCPSVVCSLGSSLCDKVLLPSFLPCLRLSVSFVCFCKICVHLCPSVVVPSAPRSFVAMILP